MARNFYALTGQPVDAFARNQLVPTRWSHIVHVHVVPELDQDATFVAAMHDVAARYDEQDGPLLLVACTDTYAELVARHKDELDPRFVCPSVDYDLLKQLNDKEQFYNLCGDYDLPYPETKIITRAMYDSGVAITSPFSFPVMLKPTESVEWQGINFRGRKKVFTIHSQVELNTIVARIYEQDYSCDLVLQDFIPGDDSHMRVINAYVDQQHHVKLMSVGRPLLVDPSPAAIGNVMAMLPAYDRELCDLVQPFLEGIGYTGLANLDLKFDDRDQTYKLLEINMRSGRSGYFLTLNGYNIAEWLVRDYVTRDLDQTNTVYAHDDPRRAYLWLGVPRHIFKRYTPDSALKNQALTLIDQAHVGTTIFDPHDFSIPRWVLLHRLFFGYNKLYKRYFAELKGNLKEVEANGN
ncbi:ATP-grasp enzyme [Lacticaseibacillus thailandensis DSM 22698 = JCM 13996]|uniref:ATP-grasp enzyme n=2 Tax=Lacticaseibacillus thailandensis TaxID=381741 RepID=A0A0R2C5S5_9LACO|nr:ATP-grasp enzyme [Lacticaseibacillus thailandensis DSM 22698 = JCM 13996]